VHAAGGGAPRPLRALALMCADVRVLGALLVVVFLYVNFGLAAGVGGLHEHAPQHLMA